MTFDDYQAIAFERDGHVFTVRMTGDRLTPQLHGELARVFAEIERDEATRVVILTSAGRHFMTGGDLDRMADRAKQRDFAPWIQTAAEARRILESLLGLSKPIVARINGHAIGFGASLALACDVTVMAAKAKLGDPHVRLGLVAGDGGALLWPILAGFPRARRYLLTGELLTAEQAAEIGLIAEVAAADAIDGIVRNIAQSIAANPPIAVRGTKSAINMVLRRMTDGLLEAHLGLETESLLSEDHREALAAMREQRPPAFKNR